MREGQGAAANPCRGSRTCHGDLRAESPAQSNLEANAVGAQ